MTSNRGGHWFNEFGPHNEKEIRNRITEALRAQFRLEFLNRIDEVIIFHSLSREHIGQIVEIQLGKLCQRLADRHIEIDLTNAARELVVAEGFATTYGARPLKRTIQRRILDPLAFKILDGAFADGNKIMVDNQSGEIVFKRADEPAHV